MGVGMRGMAGAEVGIGVTGEEAAASTVGELVAAAVVGAGFGVDEDGGVVPGMGISGLLGHFDFLWSEFSDWLGVHPRGICKSID